MRERKQGLVFGLLCSNTSFKGGVLVGDVDEEAEEEEKKKRGGEESRRGVGIRRERPPRHPSFWIPSGGEFCNLRDAVAYHSNRRCYCVVVRCVGYQ